MTELFIRIDTFGHFRGVDHCSSVNGLGEEYGNWEQGISCYLLNEEWAADTMAKLFNYWIYTASFDAVDAARCQVTIFEGEQLEANGLDNEDIAECTRTVVEFPSVELYEKWMELKKRFDYESYEGVTDAYDEKEYIEEHYEEVLAVIVKQLPEGVQL